MIFSTNDAEGYDIPLSIMSEHSFGVRSVCFSPDSRFLATLGDANDGFLFIWNINPSSAAATLHSTNKCKADVRDVIWIGNSLLTIGTRHIKFWRIEDNPTTSPARRGRSALSSTAAIPFSPSPLAGRNILLGPLVDCVFTCGVTISRQEAIIGSEDGAICLLQDDDSTQRLQLLKQNKFGLSALSFDEQTGEVVIQDKNGKTWTESVENLKNPPRSPRRVTSGSRRVSSGTPATATRSESGGTRNIPTRTSGAVTALSGFVVSTTRDGTMTVFEHSPSNPLKQTKRLESHDGPIHGVLRLPEDLRGDFLTWTSSGQIKIWNLEGCVLDTWRHTSQWDISGQGEGTNDLVAVDLCSGSNILMLGDQSGILTAKDLTTWSVIYETRAHGAQLNCVRSQVVKNVVLVATCGRDRMVQLLRKTHDTFEILQTMDDHIGAVTDVAFTTDGERLLSSSVDRTIVVRERISRQVDCVEISAYLTVRIITLKSTPLSMIITPQSSDSFVVSTMDRSVVTINVSTGEYLSSFKASDDDCDDTVALQSIALTNKGSLDGSQMLMGFSSTDKSVRVYDYETCSLITRESGHTEGISDLILLPPKENDQTLTTARMISTGLDGTIMIWELKTSPLPATMTPLHELTADQAMPYNATTAPNGVSPASLTPQRKVLTKLDINGYVRIDPISGSPLPVHDMSPIRLKRKTSRLTMVTNQIPEGEMVEHTNGLSGPKRQTVSLSPSPVLPTQKTKENANSQQCSRRSPSPPPLHSLSTPNTPHRNRPNNGRLRRPPSIPRDLRGQTLNNYRRQSMATALESGSVGVASSQACHALREFRKQLAVAKMAPDLDDLRREVEETLKVLDSHRIPPTTNGQVISTASDLDDLTDLLQKTTVIDQTLEVAS